MREIVRGYYYSPDGRYRDDEELRLLRARFVRDDELKAILRARGHDEALFERLIDEALAAPLPAGATNGPTQPPPHSNRAPRQQQSGRGL